jgi:hypothetical protein
MGLGRPLKRAATVGLWLSLSVPLAASASVVTLGFEDIGNGSFRTGLSGAYGGLDWGSSWWVQPYGYYNGARGNKLLPDIPGFPALENIQHVVNLTSDTPSATGATVQLTSTTPFFLDTVYLTGYRFGDALAPDTARTVAITGYGLDQNGGLTQVRVFSATLTSTLTAFSPGWTNPLVQVVFTPDGTNNRRVFLLDNLSVQFVPIPPSALLFASLLPGLAFALRRSRCGTKLMSHGSPPHN